MSPANGGVFLSAPHHSVTKNPNFNTHIPHPQLSQIKKAIKVVHTN
jgi:hypothetical protein